jgi:hypothetical protein|tara:strand:- start:4134 stop:4478 length:345 start_codon:yes stop_codon:yes gene_type:complete
MKTSSRVKSSKAKARVLQNWVRDQLKSRLDLTDDDVKCALMGEGGSDVKLTSEKSRKSFPFDIECKNAESVNVWRAYEQASGHGDLEPLLILKKNGKKPLVVMDANFFLDKFYD